MTFILDIFCFPLLIPLSWEEYFSISYLKPVLNLFIEGLLKHYNDYTKLTKNIKTMATEYLNVKYDDLIIDDLLDMASLVDPRFKNTYMKDEKIDTTNTRAMTEMLEEEGPSGATEAGSEEGAAAAVPTPVTMKKKTLGSCPTPAPHQFLQKRRLLKVN